MKKSRSREGSAFAKAVHLLVGRVGVPCLLFPLLCQQCAFLLGLAWGHVSALPTWTGICLVHLCFGERVQVRLLPAGAAEAQTVSLGNPVLTWLPIWARFLQHFP